MVSDVEVTGHIDPQGLDFVVESKSNRLVDKGGRRQVRRYPGRHRNAVEEVE